VRRAALTLVVLAVAPAGATAREITAPGDRAAVRHVTARHRDAGGRRSAGHRDRHARRSAGRRSVAGTTGSMRAVTRLRPRALLAPIPPATSSPAAPQPAPAAAPDPAPTATPGPMLPAPQPRSVSVRAREFAFALSQPTVLAGAVRVQFDNSAAEDPHDLAVRDGDGVTVFTFGELRSGAVQARTVTLAPGRYELVCPLAGHEALGMTVPLTVSS
jgi:hypothetical protein